MARDICSSLTNIILPPATGYRIGKGEGYADLEFGMLCEMGSYDPTNCTIISIVHDCQLFQHLEPNLFAPHDFLVDIILTPTQTIVCEKPRTRKPLPGILWNMLTHEKLKQIPILKELKAEQVSV